MRHYLYPIVLALFCCLPVKQLAAQVLEFASIEKSRKLLTEKDAYIERMSPFDRAARIKTNRDVSEREFLEFAATAALEWEREEKTRIETAYQEIKPRISELGLPLPDKIFVVKTTGYEEGRAAYTRGNSIFLPKNFVKSDKLDMRRLLAHELFHVSTRSNTKLARALYGVIGFEYCGEVVLPARLKERKITNPDAPRNDYCIKVKLDEESVWAIPILYSYTAEYDTSRGGEFFDYLQLALLLVQRSTNEESLQVIYDAQGPRLVKLDQVTGFFEQVGRNTSYVLHPEEILAENFALLVLGAGDITSPEIIEKIRSVLLEAGN